jgi:antitoxin component YwqK of YwqJK toxin-antitoxin module
MMPMLRFVLFLVACCTLFVSCNDSSGEEKKEKLISKIVDSYPNGEKKSVDYFSENNPDLSVKQEEYYPNGKLRFSLSVKNGMKHGECNYYYEDGTLWTNQHYQMDIKHGMGVVYSENGNKKMEGNYKNDKPDGKWLFYDVDGKLSLTVIYDMGNIISQK